MPIEPPESPSLRCSAYPSSRSNRYIAGLEPHAQEGSAHTQRGSALSLLAVERIARTLGAGYRSDRTKNRARDAPLPYYATTGRRER